MEYNYQNCLRPQFTERVFSKILEGKSLNPFGKKGTGKKRLLDDLEELGQQAGIYTIRIDMKPHELSYAGFLRQMETQLWLLPVKKTQTERLMADKMDAPVEKLPAVSTLLRNKEEVMQQEKLLLLFENFDVLMGSKNHRFPQDFFNDLNYVKGLRNVSLCCTTEKSHKNSMLFFEGGRTQKTSFLDLEPIDIPALQINEIREVINKRLAGQENWLKVNQHEKYFEFISKCSSPMVFMDLLIDDFTYHDTDSFKKRIKRCKAQYKRRYRVNHNYWKNGFSWTNIKSELKDLLGIYKEIKTKENDE
jgi:hypothetical protein